ncbi:hypothetical protein [Bartonella sp. DB5-6]|nr:hypothetical protein [Bartonella sp. DB5-6]
MPALSFSAGDDQQSPILAFSWNSGIVSSIHHLNIVHRCFKQR